MTESTPGDRLEPRRDRQPPATLSLDLDDKWAYMKTRADPRWTTFPSYLGVVTPRILEILADHHLRITFFIVGQDAAITTHREVLTSIAEAGHEIANHSFHHEAWFHLRPEDHIDREIALAEEHIEAATGRRPVGYRGPAYGVSEATLRVLTARRYRYDASTLPTFIGPLARAFLLRATNLTTEEKAERAALLGGVRDVLRPITAYGWDLDDGQLLEIPVTTMPFVRLPFHFNYVLYLAGYSRRLARLYFHAALHACRATGVAPSLLLGPLDFVGGEEEADLAWCPGMNLPARYKLAILHDMLAMATRHFSFMPMLTYAKRVTASDKLRSIVPRFSRSKELPA